LRSIRCSSPWLFPLLPFVRAEQLAVAPAPTFKRWLSAPHSPPNQRDRRLLDLAAPQTPSRIRQRQVVVQHRRAAGHGGPRRATAGLASRRREEACQEFSAGVVRRRCRPYRLRLVQPAAWRGPAARVAAGRRPRAAAACRPPGRRVSIGIGLPDAHWRRVKPQAVSSSPAACGWPSAPLRRDC
jgi:hypothetical protein